MSQAPAGRWLLIGNSRWHWAKRSPDGQLSGWDEAPPLRGEEGCPPLAWAAVGHPPDPAWAPPNRRVGVGDVPLTGCPAWLGVDRALAGWGAWRESKEAVLVADAGTVLSLTLVDAGGHFRGGRLLAGLALQLEAMANHTALLPRLPPPRPTATDTGEWNAEEGDPAWPRATAAAMRVGVETALAAAVVEAARASGSRRLVFTGGDGALLWQRVREPLEGLGHTVHHRPLLCLESLSRLRPGLALRPDPDP